MILSYKYRGIIMLLTFIVLLPCAVWYLALRETCQIWFRYRELASRLTTELRPPEKLEALTVDHQELIMSGALLNHMRCPKAESAIQIISYNPYITVENNGVSIHTAQLTLTSDFFSLLQYMDILEQTFPDLRIRSIEWDVSTSYKTNVKQLNLTLYIQQIILNE